MTNFNVTDALNGARVWTRKGEDVVGLTLIGNSTTSMPLCGFIRKPDGTYTSNSWTIEGSFYSSKTNNENDLFTEFVGHPWYDIDVIPTDMDGVQYSNGPEKFTSFRFYDEVADIGWEGTWEQKGTATQWANPGPTPKHLQERISKQDIIVKKGEVLLETDFATDTGKFKQAKEISWLKTKIGEPHDGTIKIVRIKQ